MASKIDFGDERFRVLEKIAKYQIEAGKIQDAFKTIKEIYDDFNIANVLEALLQKIEASLSINKSNSIIEQVLIAANVIGEGRIRSKIQYYVVKLYAQMGRSSSAIQTLGVIPDDRYKIRALLCLASEMFTKGQTNRAKNLVDKALIIADTIKDEVKRVDAISRIAVHQHRTGDLRSSDSTLSKALNTVIEINNHLSKSLAFLDLSIAQSELERDSNANISLEKAIEHACLSEEDIAQRRYVLREIGVNSPSLDFALKAVERIDAPGSWYVDDILCSVLKAQANKGEYKAAINTALKIKSDWEQGTALFKVIEQLVNRCDLKTANDLTSVIKHEYWKKSALGIMIQSYAKSGNHMAMREAANEIGLSYYTIGALVDITKLDVIEEIGSEARSLLANLFIQNYSGVDTIVTATAKIELLSKIALYYSESDSHDEVEKIFSAAIKKARNIDHTFLRSKSLAIVYSHSKEAGIQDLAETTLNEAISHLNNDIWLLTKFVNYLIELVDPERAKEVLISSLTAANNIDEIFERVKTYLEIAEAFYDLKEYEETKFTLNKALNIIKKIDDPSHDYSLFENLLFIAKVQHNIGMISEAQAILDELTLKAMQSKVHKDFYWRKIAQTLATLGDISRAVQAAKNVRVGIALPLKEIATAQVEADDLSSAMATLEKIDDTYKKDLVLETVAEKQLEAKDLTAASNTSQLIADEDVRVRVLLSIFDKYIETGHPDLANRIANMIPLEYEKNLILAAYMFSKVGDKDSFKKVLIKCSYYESLSYEIIDPLTDLYPKTADTIANFILKREGNFYV